MTLLMSFVTAEKKKTKTNENETRKENKYEKNRARLWQINSKVVFLIFALKRKEILGFSGVTKR